MASRIEGVSERLLDCATQEFLEKGYQNASLRNIADAAKTSTSSIYVRFGDKAGLFNAITGTACEAFLTAVEDAVRRFNESDPAKTFDEMIACKTSLVNGVIDVLYERFDAFRLLALKAEGYALKDFINQVADIELRQTRLYIDAIHSDVLSSGRMPEELMHSLVCAYWTGVFEIVTRNMPKDKALVYFTKLRRFFQKGWEDSFFAKE